MIKIRYIPHFLKKLKKFLEKNKSLQKKFDKTLQLLQLNRFSPALKSHKIISQYDGKIAYSSSVTKDIRIIWREENCKSIEIIECIDIGGHSGGKKVYK
jgi:mRNA-degrading endonuclease YafQ of YafQ-DinJ toxin-antitoxin module